MNNIRAQVITLLYSRPLERGSKCISMSKIDFENFLMQRYNNYIAPERNAAYNTLIYN